MRYKRNLIFILFSFLLSGCGQQGPLFMPIEDEKIENVGQETEAQ